MPWVQDCGHRTRFIVSLGTSGATLTVLSTADGSEEGLMFDWQPRAAEVPVPGTANVQMQIDMTDAGGWANFGPLLVLNSFPPP
jgi:hypothetical protein